MDERLVPESVTTRGGRVLRVQPDGVTLLSDKRLVRIYYQSEELYFVESCGVTCSAKSIGEACDKADAAFGIIDISEHTVMLARSIEAALRAGLAVDVVISRSKEG